MAVWMLLLRISSQMLNYRPDPEIEAIADMAIDAIFNYHYNPKFDLFNEVLNHDMSRPDNEYRNVVYTGHAIETMWMVMYEAVRRSDKDLFDKAAGMLKRNLEVAWDDDYGGLFRAATDIDKNIWILDKACWLQEEAIIGTLFVVENTGAQWAKEWFPKIFTYVHDKFVLEKHGFALWDIWTDRQHTFTEHCSRVENFHHPRHLMLNLLCIERMIKRNGKVSDVFD